MSGAVLFPTFIKLDGRLVLVVGGGEAVESKVHSLLTSGARVRVVAKLLTPALAQLAEHGAIHWLAREFAPDDLNGVFLAITAASADVNACVFREAEVRQILCNAIDDPDHCNFYTPAIMRRGHLQIAVSTNGLSPALAQRLRAELEQQFGPEYGEWLQWLGKARKHILETRTPTDRRRRLLHRIASRAMLQKFVNRRGAQ